MEANEDYEGFKIKLKEVMYNSQKVKLIFQYPACDRAIKKSGVVLEVFKDCFTIDEIYDGEVTYSFNYLVEVMKV